MNPEGVEITGFKLRGALLYGDMVVLKYSIEYPQFASALNQSYIERINRYCRKKAYDLEIYCTNQLYNSAVRLLLESDEKEFPFHMFELSSNFTITYNQRCILSLYTDIFQYEGGANGTERRDSNTWDIKHERGLRLCELLCVKRNCTAYAEKEVSRQIAEQLEKGGNFFADYEKLVKEYFNPKYFYVTENAVYVYFQEVTVAPHSSGIVVFELPQGSNGLERIKPVAGCGFEIAKNAAEDENYYQLRAELLLNAMDWVGVCTPERAAVTWAEGLKKRNAAIQYSVMTKRLKGYYAGLLEKRDPSWVTGVSSPWIDSYSVLERKELSHNRHLYGIEFTTATGAGFWGNFDAIVTIVPENGFWCIENIQGDNELKTYVGDFSE